MLPLSDFAKKWYRRIMERVEFIPTLLETRFSHWYLLDCWRMSTALWRPFEVQFSTFQKTLRTQCEEVRHEIALSSEKAACLERQLQCIERSSASRYRKRGDLRRQEEQIWRQQYIERESSKQARTCALFIQLDNKISSHQG